MLGRISGSVIRRKVARRSAPEVAAASSNEGSMAPSTGTVSRNTTGIHNMPSTKIMPPSE